ncbi:MAG TPA: arginine--tRNA ligase [Acidimicrobiales bacterium]|nr:arginine--tRNA ligase [Acidimicrobiales bacterium]
MTIADVLATEISHVLGELGAPLNANEIHLERPARLEHGDLSTNVALALAKRVGTSPREFASRIGSALEARTIEHVDAIEIAGPGFVNFRLRSSWLHAVLVQVVTEGIDNYARLDLGSGERVQVEFVSANPTGPLHVGNGWLGSYGDALSRVLRRCGWQVSTEYYVNDTGNQIRMLGESVLARRSGSEIPEQGYQGAYVADLGFAYNGPDEVIAAGRYAAEEILKSIRMTLDRLGIVFDEWYSQASIEESGKVAETVALMRERNLVYEEGDAVWLRSTDLGDPRDRVLIKANGDATYLAGDLAYHRDKFLVRGFDRVIDVFGADHHGQVASLEAGVEALGIDRTRLEVKLGQLVSLVSGRMSKRSGNYVRLDELIDEIGPDATRLMSLMSSIDQASTLDLDAVTARSMENPVFYVQYAYARISSIGRVVHERGIVRSSLDTADLSLLAHTRELDLLRTLYTLPSVLREAAVERAPYKVTNFARALAGEFHGFYHDCRVLGDGVSAPETQARLWLVEATRIGLSIALGLLGVSAPEKM